jgi:uncharacterized protein (TIGR03546 family)
MKVKEKILHLFTLNHTPHDIALGVAIGVFIAILPIYGFHTLSMIIAAILIRRANKIAILLGTNISLPPTVPFITWAGYEIGRLILRNGFAPLSWSDFRYISFQKVAKLYPALFVGSIILGIICAIVFYFISFFIARMLEKRKKDAR